MAVPNIPIDPPPHINDLPPAPVRGEPFEQFTAKANAFVAAQNPWGQEANALADYMESTALAAEAFANYTRDQAENAELAVISAGAFSQESQAWSEKRGSSVIDDEWSAAEHAVGDSVPTGSAKAWASGPRNVVVAGGLYSARHYALEAEDFKDTAEAAAAAAGAAAGLPAIDGRAYHALLVNASADGVTFSQLPFDWWSEPSETQVTTDFVVGNFSDRYVSLGNVSGSVDVDVSIAGQYDMTITGNTTINMTGANQVTGRVSTVVIYVTNGAAGLSLVFAGGTIVRPDGIPNRTTRNGATDIYFLTTRDGGATWALNIPMADIG